MSWLSALQSAVATSLSHTPASAHIWQGPLVTGWHGDRILPGIWDWVDPSVTGQGACEERFTLALYHLG